MFIFQRPFQAVAAGLGVALLMAYLGSHYDGIQPARAAAPSPVSNSSACAGHAACGIVRAGS